MMEARNTQSIEDYLECILMLGEKNEHVRSIDVSQELGVTKPSVSVAMKKLRERGMITVDLNGHIFLTDEGLAIAEKVYSKHKLLTNLLLHIGVDKETAADEACLIEHAISDSTYERLNELYIQMQKKK